MIPRPLWSRVLRSVGILQWCSSTRCVCTLPRSLYSRVATAVEFRSSPVPIMLTVVRGPEVGRQFTFAGPGTFVIGRSARAQFQLPSGENGDARVSHTHCLVEVGPVGCRVHDLNSHNGTFVNEQKATTADLAHGAQLRLGHTVLRVAVTPDEQPETVDWHGDIYSVPTVPPGSSVPPPAPPRRADPTRGTVPA